MANTENTELQPTQKRPVLRIALTVNAIMMWLAVVLGSKKVVVPKIESLEDLFLLLLIGLSALVYIGLDTEKKIRDFGI